MPEKAVIIFIKNAIPGKVKTRLASVIGNEAALQVYLKLVEHTSKVVNVLEYDKLLYYSDFIPENDPSDFVNSKKFLQAGSDLGQRMENAFRDAFSAGYENVVVIGTDCLQIQADEVCTAFKILEEQDAVIGPAYDGGYYLIGMNKLLTDLFRNKTWSSPNLLNQTTESLVNLNLTYKLLPMLADVDEYTDLVEQNIEHIYPWSNN